MTGDKWAGDVLQSFTNRLDPNETFFTKNGSDEFALKYQKYHFLNKTNDTLTKGGLYYDGAMSPYEMGQAFLNWKATLDNDSSLSVGLEWQWANWYDISQVSNVIDKMSNATLTELFTKAKPSTPTFELMADSYWDYQ